MILTSYRFCSNDYGPCKISQDAVLLMEAHAHLTSGLQSKERLLLLFTDSLIIAKTKYVNVSVGVSMCINVLEFTKGAFFVLLVTGL